MPEMKSKHAFGSEANVDNAIEQGLIDAYDVLFLNEGKIGWVDRDGNKVILLPLSNHCPKPVTQMSFTSMAARSICGTVRNSSLP